MIALSSRVLFCCANQGFCYLNLTWATKFKYEKKNEKNSGRSSKMTPRANGLLRPTFFQVVFIFLGLIP